MSDHRTPSELHDALVGVVRGVESLDLRLLENEPAAEVYRTAYEPTRGAIDESLSLLRELLRRYEAEHDPPSQPRLKAVDDWRREYDLGVDAIVQQLPSVGRITDLAFMATMELRNKQHELQTLKPDGDPWHLIGALESARRRVRKSLTAVCTVLCHTESLEPELNFASEVASSLEVRRVYTSLRTSIGAGSPPDEGALYGRLRGVGTQIAMLVGRGVYRELRIGDRAQLRALQTRILEWMRSYEGTEDDLLAGRRLWQDLAGFAQVLSLVNNRQELLEHDAHVVAIARGILQSGASKDALPERLLERLAALRGLDDETDALLEAKEAAAEPWRAALDRLAGRFGIGKGASSDAGEAFELL